MNDFIKVLPLPADKTCMKGDKEMKTNRYKVFEAGLYIGTMELTADQVRNFTAAAVYTLKAEN